MIFLLLRGNSNFFANLCFFQPRRRANCETAAVEDEMSARSTRSNGKQNLPTSTDSWQSCFQAKCPLVDLRASTA